MNQNTYYGHHVASSLSNIGVLYLVVSSNLWPGESAPFFPATRSMDHYCGRHLTVHKSMRIELHDKPRMPECTVYFDPASQLGLMATFVNYHFRRTYKRCDELVQMCTGSRCVFEEPGYCENVRPKYVFQLGSNSSLTYISQVTNFNIMSFTILLTEVSYVRENATGACEGYYFDCQMGHMCIHISLVCNYNDDCGNGEDESATCWQSTMQALLFISILLVVPGLISFSVYFTIGRAKPSRRKSSYKEFIVVTPEVIVDSPEVDKSHSELTIKSRETLPSEEFNTAERENVTLSSWTSDRELSVKGGSIQEDAEIERKTI